MKNTYISNIHRRLHIAFSDQFLVEIQGPLNLCCVNNQFLIKICISREVRKQCLKCIFMYSGEIYEK